MKWRVLVYIQERPLLIYEYNPDEARDMKNLIFVFLLFLS